MAKELTGYEIYDRIKFVASKRGIKIRQLALKAGFKSPNTIYNYKNGSIPSAPSLRAIANALPTTTNYLLGKTDDWHIHPSTADGNNTNDIRPADLTSPVLALDGREIVGEQAEQIRQYAKFLISQEEKDNKKIE